MLQFSGSAVQFYEADFDLNLEQGGQIRRPTIAYHTYGSPDKPVIWVCHALTANSDVFDWWGGLFGPNDLFNPNDFYIICANVLGGCYGTTGPLSENPDSGETYYHDFPKFTIRDIVMAHESLRKNLKINKIHLIIGGSLGGQQALEWAILKPDLFEHLALIATNARHSAWGIAFNEAQRMAIQADSTWQERHPKAGDAGMKAARATALLSYRNYATYAAAQTDESAVLDQYKAATYQQYQGEKLSRRFNAYTYYRLSEAMDSHHVGRDRGLIEQVLKQVTARTLVIGISSDVLFPPVEQQFLAQHIPETIYVEIDSFYGHDGFLIETERLSKLLRDFLGSAGGQLPVLKKAA
jgi:homoserine O-acetyltransferase/O-succinyltransferase